MSIHLPKTKLFRLIDDFTNSITSFQFIYRLIPMVCIFVLYIKYILPYTSDGPLWDIEVRNEIGKCTDPWWTIPLAVNNWIISSNRLVIYLKPQPLFSTYKISSYVKTSYILYFVIHAVYLGVMVRSRKYSIVRIRRNFITDLLQE